MSCHFLWIVFLWLDAESLQLNIIHSICSYIQCIYLKNIYMYLEILTIGWKHFSNYIDRKQIKHYLKKHNQQHKIRSVKTKLSIMVLPRRYHGGSIYCISCTDQRTANIYLPHEYAKYIYLSPIIDFHSPIHICTIGVVDNNTWGRVSEIYIE